MSTRLALALLLVLPGVAPAGPLTITVTGGKTDEANVVCTAKLPAGSPANPNCLIWLDKTAIPAKRVNPALLDPQDRSQYLVFVLSKLKAGETATLVPGDDISTVEPAFRFAPEKDGQTNLLLGERKVLSYFHPKHDPANHFYTFKPFHHVYDPTEGKQLLTSGAYKDPKEGLFPHHRGLFYGWNRISYDGKTADIWHGTDSVYSQYEGTGATEAGHGLGRERSVISWHGKDGQTFATEERELTAYAVPGGTLIDFASELKTDRKSVKLDGDPQHAGFHFRANMEVAEKTKGETYYLRPDGKGKPGETRNWDPKGADPRTVNLPWDAMCFVVGGKRYTVLRVGHPDNPKDARGSERDYGRFGDYFAYELTPEKPLRVKYRVWVQAGEMTGEQCTAIAAGFVSPPAVKVVEK
jgi:hypothetical protein